LDSFFVYPFIYHQEIKIIVEGQVALLITEIILAAFLGAVNIGKMIEVETFFHQFLFMHPGFFGFVKALQYPPVLAQDVVDIPDEVGVVAVQLVVIGVAAHVGTEFFVDSSAEFFAAFEAGALCAHL